jgi:glucosamine-6-phosphate deaminase
VVVIITGAHKALALQKCIEGGVNHMWTLSSLQSHPHPMIVVDEDATLELQVKTVKVRTQHQPPGADHSRKGITKAETQQYFKSIEMVATELGFRQKLPRKRDSLVDEGALLVPQYQTTGISLTVPQQDISRSASPVFEPMSARIDDEDTEAKASQTWDAVEDQPSVRMSARVAG